MIELSLSNTPEQLADLPDQLRDGQTVTFLKDGKPVLAVLPWDLYEAMLELIEIPSDAQTLLAAPAVTRARLLTVAAARAETLYQQDLDLLGFDAFGDDDLDDAADPG